MPKTFIDHINVYCTHYIVVYPNIVVFTQRCKNCSKTAIKKEEHINRYGLYKGSKIKNCPRHAVIGLNQRFLHNYTYEKKIFEKNCFLGHLHPFLCQNDLFCQKSHILLISWFLIF